MNSFLTSWETLWSYIFPVCQFQLQVFQISYILTLFCPSYIISCNSRCLVSSSFSPWTSRAYFYPVPFPSLRIISFTLRDLCLSWWLRILHSSDLCSGRLSWLLWPTLIFPPSLNFPTTYSFPLNCSWPYVWFDFLAY